MRNAQAQKTSLEEAIAGSKRLRRATRIPWPECSKRRKGVGEARHRRVDAALTLPHSSEQVEVETLMPQKARDARENDSSTSPRSTSTLAHPTLRMTTTKTNRRGGG